MFWGSLLTTPLSSSLRVGLTLKGLFVVRYNTSYKFQDVQKRHDAIKNITPEKFIKEEKSFYNLNYIIDDPSDNLIIHVSDSDNSDTNTSDTDYVSE